MCSSSHVSLFTIKIEEDTLFLFKTFKEKGLIVKYQLETIPVWDAYKADSECPLCSLEKKLEKSNVQFFLGGSVMEPDIRGMVNEMGFCAVHFDMLFHAGNKLGLALMTHTHLRFLQKKTGKCEKNLSPKTVDEVCRFLLSKKNECMLCYKLEKALKRYAFTIIYLWKKDDDFRQIFENSKGFCLPHFAQCMNMADEVLSSKKKEAFLYQLYTFQMKNIKRVEEELHWFTQKFDYKNRDKPWKNSKDALQRTIQKLVGKIIE